MYVIKASLVAEVYRYMGVHGNEHSRELEALVSTAIERVSMAASPSACQKIMPVSVHDGRCVTVGERCLESADLASHLEGCDQVILFAATLGCDVDRLIDRDSLLRPSLAVAEHAAATVLIEQFSDECCEQTDRELGDDVSLTPRFSPGYGDCPLSCQTVLLHQLEAYKQIGLTLTDKYMMTPVKSISGWLGVTNEKRTCFSKGCAMCLQRHCAFRKEGNVD
ncbi:MAG: hypothetical protein IJD01_08815 [Clostridia bacterium]|nr:hypothetical protein [Clostridia bacterium]